MSSELFAALMLLGVALLCFVSISPMFTSLVHQTSKLQADNRKLCKAFGTAISIIRNDAASEAYHGTDHEAIRRRWADELVAEAGLTEDELHEDGSDE